ncbi:sugar ABC transporter ATP-binding protein [Microvirga ossetica]|jgi:ribose transport system ATP-binding protein|nr:sugar ABC transporter ATP-binding protein [Microvirga ossetica]
MYSTTIPHRIGRTTPALAQGAAQVGRQGMTLLRTNSIRKSFGPVEVLKEIDFAVSPGEVTALVGENGAGKSTLMKIIAGYEKPSSGHLLVDGSDVFFETNVDAEASGIVLVHQEFCLIPHLTVAENIFLGYEPTRRRALDYAAMEQRAAILLEELGSTIHPRTLLSKLAVSDWQMIEIAKALSRRPRLLIMDEPTAVLGHHETDHLFERVDRFRQDGGAVIFTSHKLDEVKRLADQTAILRDGRIVIVAPTSSLTEDEMASLMVGRPLSDLYPTKHPKPDQTAVLSVRELEVPGYVERASFDLKKGEILGFSGLVGSGRTELFEGLFGLRPAHCKTFAYQGRGRHLPTPREAYQMGMAYLTEDRKGHGLLLEKSLGENLTLLKGALVGGTVIDLKAERAELDRAITTYEIKAPKPSARVGTLSGGNQQKLLIAKTLLAEPDVIVFDEPTRGIDIGTKQQIYRLIQSLAAAGKACVVISSEMQEIIGLSHRVMIMRQGRIVGEVAGDAMNEDEIVRYAVGLKEAPIHV